MTEWTVWYNKEKNLGFVAVGVSNSWQAYVAMKKCHKRSGYPSTGAYYEYSYTSEVVPENGDPFRHVTQDEEECPF